MKKSFILLAITTLVLFNANAAKDGITSFQKGDIDIGFMLGLPPERFANMPTLSVDAAWALISGFIETKSFGQNGGVDLGFYASITSYDHVFQDCVLARSAFHFQFIEHLDTYAGILAGVNVWVPTGSARGARTYTNAAFGMYVGAKYYFTHHVGAKLEFASDFNEGDVPWLSVGVTFKF